jgi:hypothetical protein
MWWCGLRSPRSTLAKRSRSPMVTSSKGDVFVLPSRTHSVVSGFDEAQSVSEYRSDKSEVWDAIVSKYSLRQTSLQAFVGHGDQHADFAFAYSAAEEPRAFVSTVKLGRAGFTRV